ncbi:PREDICTED: pentatricopeptide repeat-containing protein At5g43790 [Tarenaya hassleriana]|uniref:pentatricopeptide repeat-containing protein At5g43790 n=1 Tax=Tarenaya hassleriana TaxID=28532 RepID=UPI00053C540E|nr:PREDICTED: pentatricopeptide repeat-containing protein At5g43790 [Tarenaya hassleriana]
MTSPSTSHEDITLNLIPRCRTLGALKQIHGRLLTTGLSRHTFPISKLLLLSSTLSLPYALSVFHRIRNPSVFLFNTLISSVVSIHGSSHTHIVISLYSEVLCSRDVRPNAFTYPSLFKACGCDPRWHRHGRSLHAHILKFLDHESCDRFVLAGLVGFYANCGKLGVARTLFDRISEPDLATWNTVLTAYTRVGDAYGDGDLGSSAEVLQLFGKMQRSSSVKPNEVSLVALIKACTNIGAFWEGFWAHVYLIKNNLNLNQFVGTSLIDFYAKCGCLNLARQVFDKMPHRDTSCYNAMIRGLAIHGLGHEALEVYEKMISRGLIPDDATFLVTISACSHSGLVEEGLGVFHSIKGAHGVEPKVEHYGCLVDLLGRAGRLKEAEEWIEKMPMKPNAKLWRSFLGAATIHGDLERGQIAQKNLLGLEPENGRNYVLLSNIYAGVDRWNDVERARELMKTHGVDKSPGISTNYSIVP